MRCLSPFSNRLHSAAETMRGTMSNGKIFSTPACSPYTLNVIPICINTRSAAACRRASSPGGSDWMLCIRFRSEREDLLHSSLLAIPVKRDPHLHQHALRGRLPPRKLPRRQRLDAMHQVSRARASHLGVRQELVIEAPYLVAGKVHKYKMSSSTASATHGCGR